MRERSNVGRYLGYFNISIGEVVTLRPRKPVFVLLGARWTQFGTFCKAVLLRSFLPLIAGQTVGGGRMGRPPWQSAPIVLYVLSITAAAIASLAKNGHENGISVQEYPCSPPSRSSYFRMLEMKTLRPEPSTYLLFVWSALTGKIVVGDCSLRTYNSSKVNYHWNHRKMC